MDNSKKVQSIERAVSILKCFSERRKEMKLSEIADELDLNKSTVHGIISTLKYHGLIDQDEETQKYKLGLYLMVLGDIVSSSIDIRVIAHPIIEKVSQQLDETVHLSKLHDLEIVYLDKVESNQSMRIFTTIGSRMPAHRTGMGKALLAYVDYNTLSEVLPENLEPVTPVTPNTIVSKRELLKQLEEIRKCGYAIDNEESTIGLRCIAAPIFDHKGTAKYGISVSGPTVRMTDERIDSMISIVKSCAREISYKLGYVE